MERPLKPLIYKNKEDDTMSTTDPLGNGRERPLKPLKLKGISSNTKESKKEEQPKITIHIDNINIYLNKD